MCDESFESGNEPGGFIPGTNELRKARREQMAQFQSSCCAINRVGGGAELLRRVADGAQKGEAHCAEVMAEVMAERRKQAVTPERWMWEAAVWRFINVDAHARLLVLASKLKEEG